MKQLCHLGRTQLKLTADNSMTLLIELFFLQCLFFAPISRKIKVLVASSEPKWNADVTARDIPVLVLDDWKLSFNQQLHSIACSNQFRGLV